VSFSYGRDGSATGGVGWQSAPAPKDTQVKDRAPLSLTATVQALDEPFGFLSTVPVINGELSEKWKTLRDQVDLELSVLSRCATKKECPAAPRQFLAIMAVAREHQGLAHVGVINRAVNLSIVPTSDMKQWGSPGGSAKPPWLGGTRHAPRRLVNFGLSNATRPEIATRSAVHALGIRFRNHAVNLPGKPDLANCRKRWAIFVHGWL